MGFCSERALAGLGPRVLKGNRTKEEASQAVLIGLEWGEKNSPSSFSFDFSPCLLEILSHKNVTLSATIVCPAVCVRYKQGQHVHVWQKCPVRSEPAFGWWSVLKNERTKINGPQGAWVGSKKKSLCWQKNLHAADENIWPHIFCVFRPTWVLALVSVVNNLLRHFPPSLIIGIAYFDAAWQIRRACFAVKCYPNVFSIHAVLSVIPMCLTYMLC